MLNKLIDKLKEIVGSIERFDPSRFNDPIAEQTGWGPVKDGGTNFRTHKLSKTSEWQINFKPTIGAILFASIFLIIGLSVIGFSIITNLRGEWYIRAFFFLFGLIFASVGGGLIYKYTSPITFDKQSGAFWKGRKSPAQMDNTEKIKECVWISNIHALQIISEYCSSSSSNGSSRSYRSYELNLVMNDAKRINVIDHGNYAKLRKDAETLADFLGIPLWDSI